MFYLKLSKIPPKFKSDATFYPARLSSTKPINFFRGCYLAFLLAKRSVGDVLLLHNDSRKNLPCSGVFTWAMETRLISQEEVTTF
jgi:hypothetical protein